MFGNSGYIGSSRSVRSENAISSYEVPLSYISKDLIRDFAKHYHENTDVNYPQKIFRQPVYLWKDVAKTVGPSSWHHTGKYFQETDHYELTDIADYLTHHDIKALKAKYRQRKTRQKAKLEQQPALLAVIKYNVWGGTRNYRHIVDHDIAYGYVKKTAKAKWLVSYNAHKRFRLPSSNVTDCKFYHSLKPFKKRLGKHIDLRKFKAFLKSHRQNIPRL